MLFPEDKLFLFIYYVSKCYNYLYHNKTKGPALRGLLGWQALHLSFLYLGIIFTALIRCWNWSYFQCHPRIELEDIHLNLIHHLLLLYRHSVHPGICLIVFLHQQVLSIRLHLVRYLWLLARLLVMERRHLMYRSMIPIH